MTPIWLTISLIATALSPIARTSAEYRSYDGRGNNIKYPNAGSAGTPYLQGPASLFTSTGDMIPSPDLNNGSTSCTAPLPPGNWPMGRCVSDILMSYATNSTDTKTRLATFTSQSFKTHMVTHFAHFISFDLTASSGRALPVTIMIPTDDGMYQSPGSSYLNGSVSFTPTDRIPNNITNDPSQQTPVRTGLNFVTSYLDGSNIYGSSLAQVIGLREPQGCRMRTRLGSDGHALPPLGPDGHDDVGFFSKRSGDVFKSMFSTLFLREHNRYCDSLKATNPEMDDSTAFEETRAYIIALVQHITYTEYLGMILGTTLPAYNGYDPNLEPGIDTLWASSTFRYGHTELGDSYPILDRHDQLVHIMSFQESRTSLNIDDYGFENLVRVCARQSQEEVDIYYSDQARNYRSMSNEPVDLAQTDVLRGRDRGLPLYNDARRHFGLTPAKTWSDITSNPRVQDALKRVYGTVDRVETTTGALSEDHESSQSSLGPLFQASMKDQFIRIRAMDRFWYENDGVLAPDVLNKTALGAWEETLSVTSTNFMAYYSVVFPASIFIVRYQKHRFGNAMSIHRHIQLLTGFSIATLASAAIATATPGLYLAHKVMGVTILVAVIGQVGLGLISVYTLGQLESANKGFPRAFKWAHRALGTGVLLLAWVNIYFGLVAYNAPLSYIYGYLAYICVLVVSVTIYHYRWRKSGFTVKGTKRVLVQDYLDRDDEKHGLLDSSISESKKLLLSWPQLTWEAINMRVSSGAKLVVVDGYVFDIREWIPSHPGGAKVLERVIGTDITMDFYGHTSMRSPGKSSAREDTTELQEFCPTPSSRPASHASSDSVQLIGLHEVVGQLRPFKKTSNLPKILETFDEHSRTPLDTRRESLYRRSFFLPQGELPTPPTEKKALIDRIIDKIKGLSNVLDRWNIKMVEGDASLGEGNTMTRALATHAHSARAIQRLARYCIGIIDHSEPTSQGLRRRSSVGVDPKRMIFKRYILTSKTTLNSELAPRPVRRFTFRPCIKEPSPRQKATKFFMPGEYVEIQCRVDDQISTRAYTPIEGSMDDEFAIYVKIYSDGLVSKFLDKQYPGYEIRIRGPFEVADQSSTAAIVGTGLMPRTAPFQIPRVLLSSRLDGCWDTLMMVAGGTGLNPMLQLIYHHIRHQNDDKLFRCQLFLLFLNRTHRDVFAGQQLDELVELADGRLIVDYGINEAGGDTPGVFRGHVTPQLLTSWFHRVASIQSGLIAADTRNLSGLSGEQSATLGDDYSVQSLMRSFVRPNVRVVVSGPVGLMDKTLEFLENSSFPADRTAAGSDYMVELIGELPLAISQFGLVLLTALELKENKGGVVHPKNPEAMQELGPEQPHYRSRPIPLSDAVGQPPTVVDVTISGYAATFYARCESLLMNAAISAASAAESSAEECTDLASAENMSLALQKHPSDPVIQGHYQNVRSVVSDILAHRLDNSISSDNGHDKNDEESPEMFYCINDIWKPALASHATSFSEVVRAVKFVITEKDLLSAEPEIRLRCRELEESEGLVLGPMVESDVKLMIASNKVPYSESYGREIIKRSQCFRNSAGEMVAWAGTHGDFSIAALYVLPEYRKMGLGRLVLQSLALMHVRLARGVVESRMDAPVPSTALYAHADCLDDNTATMVFMERCGWRRVGNFLWVGLIPKPRVTWTGMPKDKKTSISKGGDKSEKLVLDYLIKQNRPFSVSDIVANLHAAVSKTECQRAVNALVDRDLVTTKLYGKQAIYVVRQDTIETASSEELAALDKEITQLQTQIAEYKSRNRQLSSQYSVLNSALTTDQIAARLEQMTSKNQQSQEHLTMLRAGTQLVTAEEKRQVVKDMEYHRKLWTGRRRLFKDMFAAVTENMPGKPKDLLVCGK
ncbi:hypothetical protein BGX28_003653 [Mortierella sp. GBA30]|nr:hypothetical protein BGX28_003653 [Mortierella sp. GBA30]